MTNNEKLLTEIKKLGYIIEERRYKDEDAYKENNFTYRYWRLPEENGKLYNTPFFYNKENDFIHFTSLEALYSIINTKHIRLYNLVSMDDKFEMEYAKKELLFRESIEEDKEQLYCFSMCSTNDVLKKEEKEHLLWKLYGKNGYGVIIRLNIQNDLKSWYNYHLTKVFYGLENFQSVKKLNENTGKEGLDVKLACFVKLPIYKFENEIRLIFDNRNPTIRRNKNGQITYPIIYSDKLHKSDKIFYFQLPLLNFLDDKDDELFFAPNMENKKYEIPKIKITEIILGYRYSKSDLKNIQCKIANELADVNIKITDLKQYY